MFLDFLKNVKEYRNNDDDDQVDVRSLAYNNSFWSNFTEDDDFASQLIPASDVSVHALVTTLYWNAIAFVVIMLSYEILRRLLPAVYSSQSRRQLKAGVIDPSDERCDESIQESSTRSIPRTSSAGSVDRSLPDIISPNWVSSVLSVSWNTIRKYSGLDGYFFLRYIRMNLRICAVTSFWAFAILIPVYSTGTKQNNEEGWYHLSVGNITKGSWRMWVPSCFAYLLTGFIFFVMKQEYRHFLELRMEFLARGSSHVIKQHHYSLLVENIPNELRSEKALFDYFNKLFPGKVHSTTVILNLKDLEYIKSKTVRVCRRLEKSIAHYRAKGERPTHNVGSPRINILGVELAPFDWSCGSYPNVAYVDNRLVNERPLRGTHVDSISYYTYDLADCNKKMYFMQQRKTEIAFSGNSFIEADTWFSRLMMSAHEAAEQILVDSAEENALRASYGHLGDDEGIPQAELMSSRYGSFGPLSAGMSPRVHQRKHETQDSLALGSGLGEQLCLDEEGLSRAESEFTKSEVIVFSKSSIFNSYEWSGSGVSGMVQECSSESRCGPSQGDLKTNNSQVFQGLSRLERRKVPPVQVQGNKHHTNLFRRLAGRLGLDFVVSGFKYANSQLDSAMESVVGATMSSTGFVTFLDLTSVTCAATTPLTSKPKILNVSVAPEPRDIIWANAHVSAKTRARNEKVVNFFLFLSLFFWIVPLTLIQAFAKAEYIARIPGMEWVAQSGSVSSFVNGYLPVVGLLCLILILPLIFKFLATTYEKRLTYSDVQQSMMGRYFYYQVFNIYVTVTAGSLWRSLGDILDHPSMLLELLGESLPSMVGYFIAILVTKVLAGLPIVFVRIGALARMLLLRSISSNSKLTQRELDEIYRPENVQLGWEFPSQLLVIMIVFTYAIISPIILPVGALFFVGALVVYKKQVLYVYRPVYESGGAMFPSALQRTLFGLVCGQLTLIGYLITRGFYSQLFFLLPLPLATMWGMRYFEQYYVEPSKRLSLERAREYDRVTEIRGEESECDHGVKARRVQFTKDSFRQPVLTRKAMVPRSYRRGQVDPLTEECRTRLKQLQEYSLMEDGDSDIETSESGKQQIVAEDESIED